MKLDNHPFLGLLLAMVDAWLHPARWAEPEER